MSIPKSQKLELTWIGKGDEPKLEPRILIENPEYSYGTTSSPSGGGQVGANMLIHGDNLLALKALEQDYAGKVKCIYIDPPYNTGNAFEHYDDGVEHSLWLSLMSSRLRLLHKLLAKDGTIWITLDDNEVHYCKALCDEIFGRQNFIQGIIWKSSDNSNNDAKQFSIDHNTIIVYSKTPDWLSKRLIPKDSQTKHFKNPDNDPRGPWFDGNPISSPAYRENLSFEIQTPIGTKISPPKNGWRWSKETLQEKMNSGEIFFNKNFTNIKRRTYLSDSKGLPPSSLWSDLEETGHNRQAKYEQKKLFPYMSKEEWFGTPKPEKLIKKILQIATDENDLVLDSFLGSGTTAAVSHKMRRRWIGIELGAHCLSHSLPRLQMVVDNNDSIGISEEVDWKGGGGFKFYTLAPSLLNLDKFGNWVINKEYNPDMLAAAMAKQEGFKYAPDEAIFWKQGRSMERDFLFTTTQFLTVEALDRIQEEMKPEETLLICCKAYQPECENRHTSITIKKIPSLLLDKCEFGQDDYSLKIVQVPTEDQEGEGDSEENLLADSLKIPAKTKTSKPTQPDLFD
jgi:adenine-specific DNA-methyltransferase